ncbi:MAG: hypothetical protein WA865_18600 [Spirulinaceae cyanobacterium]
MTIQLKPEQEKFVKAQVTSGKYNSPEEVMDRMFLLFERLQSAGRKNNCLKLATTSFSLTSNVSAYPTA